LALRASVNAPRSKRLGNRRAVDVHELAGGARPQAVDEAGDETLARPGLALEEDRGQPPADVLAPGQPPDGLPYGFHRGAPTQELAPWIHRR
jgi:hypothetical protein